MSPAAPRIVFLGNDRRAASALESMIAAEPRVHEPALVLTRTPRPSRRGGDPVPTPVADASRRLGLPLTEVATVLDDAGRAILTSARPDVLVVVAYGEILPPDLLGVPSIAAVNLHLSLLPRWRGASPIQHAILAGDTETGATTMLLEAGLDTGPILETATTPLGPEEDAGSLGTRLARTGGALLASTIDGLVAGTLHPTPQPVEGVTWAAKLTATDRTIRWADDADAIGRRVRAFAPEPAARTPFRGRVLKVFRGTPEPGPTGDALPGAIVATDEDGVLVATGSGAFRLSEVGPEGKARMPAVSWARGARFEPDERLG